MARAWKRATNVLKCGSLNDCLIQVGEPYLVLSGEGWAKVRCALHAGRAVPDTIDEPQPMPAKSTSGFASAKQLAKVLPMGPKLIQRDFKLDQAGDEQT